MGKNIKNYATIPKVHFPQEREGSLMAKSPNLSAKIQHGLTVHTFGSPSLKNYKQKFSIFKSLFQSKLQQIIQILLNSPTIPVNYAKFTTKFIHIHSMLSDF